MDLCERRELAGFADCENCYLPDPCYGCIHGRDRNDDCCGKCYDFQLTKANETCKIRKKI